MTRRAKKLIKKPDPQEESSDDSDSGEDQTQLKKGKVTRTTRMKSFENKGAENVPTSAEKKGKTKTKKGSPKEMEEEIMEKSKQKVKKMQGKMSSKSIEPEEESNSSDEVVTEKPNQKVKKIQGKKPVKSIEPEEEASNSSDEEIIEKPKQKVKKLQGKKSVKSIEPEEEASNSSDEEIIEKPKQKVKKLQGKKSVKSIEPEEEASNSSDEEITEKPKQKVKKLQGKKPVKSIEPEEEASNSSGSKDKFTKRIKKEKKKKVLKQPGVADSSDESGDNKSSIKKKIKALKGLKVEAQEISTNTDTEKKPIFKDDLSDSEISSDSGIKHDMDSYKDSMLNLKSIDPDFYKFLEMHDAELLDLDEYGKGLDEREDDDEEDIHVPDEKLHVDSDESDFEDDNAAPIKGQVTQQMITDLNKELTKEDGKMKLSTIVLATKLFNGAVRRATSDDGSTEGEFKVAGSGVFNNVINMCVLYLPGSIKKYLGIEHSKRDPTKCKHFVKIKSILVQYLNDVMKLLKVVTSENILVVMLKHLHQMAAYIACFLRIAKKAIRTMLPMWSSGVEPVRVLSFVCILRLARNQNCEFLELVLKAMYMTYIKNSKFVSPSTWPGINFMRRSLVEMFLLNLEITYPIAFVYIRQLGIHLRNAIMVPKRENTQAVYNWQFLNALHLWAHIIPHTMHRQHINTLIFPLTMIISNTIKMKPTPQYYPLRFHLTEILIQMSRESGKFIPIQGYLMDVLTKFDFNKTHKKVSMKPLDFSCLIRLNKSQMNENGYKDAVVERLYALLLEYTSDISCQLAFPDVSMILQIHLSDAAHKCTSANYKRKFKQLEDKIEESAEYIRKIRFTNQMSLCDVEILLAEQRSIKAEGTPLMTFYENWRKVNNIKKRKAVTQNDQLAGEIPIIKRIRISEVTDDIIMDENLRPVKLFPSDSEDETDDIKPLVDNDKPPKDKSKQTIKKKRNNKEKIKQNEVKSPDVADDTADVGDIVQEFSW